MECPIEDLTVAVMEACRAYAQLLAEYSRLAFCSELGENDIEQLAAIYTKAESEPLLNFLINELDYILNQRLGLLTINAVDIYKNQQAWLREHLEQMPLECEHRKEMQRLLREEGFYEGPIDGVFGDRSTKAVQQFRVEVQRLLHKKGFYKENIDGVFGKHSIAAVKQFQRSQALTDDGVPGKQTFSALQLG